MNYWTQADLPILPFPPANMPSDGPYETATKSSQAVADGQYLDQVKGYVDRGAAYITTETLKRNASTDHKNYPRVPFPAPIPRRQIVGWTPNDWGSADMTFALAPPDPRIQPPTLPEWVDAAPSGRGPLSGNDPYVPPADPVATLKPILEENNRMLKAMIAEFKVSMY